MLGRKKNIVWLASYPKSGNTWFRVFLGNMLTESNYPKNINELFESPISSNRNIIDKYLGINSSELSQEEIANLRPEVYKKISEENKDLLYLKTHDAWSKNSRGIPIFPEEVTKGVIYIIRNPLDIAISFSFHNNESIDQTISFMNNDTATLCAKKDRLYRQTRQIITSWSNHVISWTDMSNLPIHIIRYEDMLEKPYYSFKNALNFLNLNYSESRIIKAIEHSSFDVLKDLENSNGFKEKSIHSEVFFRKGRSNEWKSALSKAQIDTIIEHNYKVMNKFGY